MNGDKRVDARHKRKLVKSEKVMNCGGFSLIKLHLSYKLF